MLFCPNCDNILNISKNPPKGNKLPVQLDLGTPDNVTDSEDATKSEKPEANDAIEEIINTLANDENVTDSVLSELKIEQITKHKSYQKLDKKKKTQILAKLTPFYEKIDDAVGAYYSCKNCMYSRAIEPGSLIVSRMNGNTSVGYMNLERLENRKYSKILPLTRNYICNNKKCPTNETGSNRKPKEAVFFRINGSMQAWYTCTLCGSYWKGQ